MRTKRKVSLTFVGDNKVWQMFRQACKLRHSDASKELRKYMDKFIEDNLDLLIQDNEERAIEEHIQKEKDIKAKAEREHELQSKMSFE